MQGIVICCVAVIIGSLLGPLLKKIIPAHALENVSYIFSLVSFVTAFLSIMKAVTLLPIAISLIIGGLIGYSLNLEEHVKTLFMHGKTAKNDSFISAFMSFLTLICISGAGIYGSMIAGITGDTSILYVKAMLDVVAAMSFAAAIGRMTLLVVIPEAAIMFSLYFLAGWLAPYLTEAAIGNLNACGGVIILATAFKLGGMSNYASINLLPALMMIIPATLLTGDF